jgi:N-acetylglucosaminyl-diphospho-decaprenol L-rhamnosyltransferase
MPSLSRVDTNVRERRLVGPSLRAAGGQAMAEAIFDLDVGVIYSGERHYMTPLVTSLAGSAEGLSLRLLLVDNASTDGVSAWTHMCSHTKVVTNARAYGYAANLNRILAASDARYALLLNTDMYFDVDDQCLAKMVQFMDDRPGCGLSICQIYRPDGSYGYPARRFPTWRAIAARRLGLQRLCGASLREHLYANQSVTSSFPCDWVSGCFMLVRRDAIRDIGGFDERYGKYFEDVDVCLRMARAGWQVMFNGATRCFHHEQRASRSLFSRDAWRHGRAYLRWLLKWGLSTPSTAGPTRALPRPAARADHAHATPGSAHLFSAADLAAKRIDLDGRPPR